MAAEKLMTEYTQEIIQRVRYHQNIHKITGADIAREIGYSRTSLSYYLNGKRNVRSDKLETALAEYLDRHSVPVTNVVTPFPQQQQERPQFFESEDATRIIGVCASSQEYSSLGLIIGESGYGKSYALRQYAKMPRVAYVECSEIMGIADLTRSVERSIGIAYKGHGSAWERVQDILYFFQMNPGYLLIIDEADKLISKSTQKRLEAIRSIFDGCRVGIVMAGEPKLKPLIECYSPRVENRIEFFEELQGLKKQEVSRYLAGYDIEPDAMQELYLRASTGRKSCFRFLDRTMQNIRRIWDKRGDTEKVITLELVREASSMMMR